MHAQVSCFCLLFFAFLRGYVRNAVLCFVGGSTQRGPPTPSKGLRSAEAALLRCGATEMLCHQLLFQSGGWRCADVARWAGTRRRSSPGGIRSVVF